MKNWKDFIEQNNLSNLNIQKDKLKEEYGVYGDSINTADECTCFIALDENKKVLIVTDGSSYDDFCGDETIIADKKVKMCELSNFNSAVIRRIFDFTNPISAKGRDVSIGLGDRLGLASAGHIRLIKGTNIFPVLAQQSIRELNLTNRTYENVLADTVWAVLQEGYKDGYGADGDHLKTRDEVGMALDCGFTMITLDCSEYIDNDINSLADDELTACYGKLGEGKRKYWEDKYLNKKHDIGLDDGIEITRDDLMKTVLIYAEAIDFAIGIYNDLIKDYKKDIDFEISIDETLSATEIEAHFIIANEINDKDVKMINMAPRFCGAFEKGIDYRGDVEQFEEEFVLHSAIAEHFGYKIGVHSGSDKFSIFPIVGEKTNLKFHVKTAGTNWLEAIRVIGLNKPELFRRMYKYALKRLPDAKKFYHIFTESDMVPDIDDYTDAQLPELMSIEESRQALHVTYGYLLCDKNQDGSFMFRDEFFSAMQDYEDSYYEMLKNHIGHHLKCLGL